MHKSLVGVNHGKINRMFENIRWKELLSRRLFCLYGFASLYITPTLQYYFVQENRVHFITYLVIKTELTFSQFLQIYKTFRKQHKQKSIKSENWCKAWSQKINSKACLNTQSFINWKLIRLKRFTSYRITWHSMSKRLNFSRSPATKYKPEPLW